MAKQASIEQARRSDYRIAFKCNVSGRIRKRARFNGSYLGKDAYALY